MFLINTYFICLSSVVVLLLINIPKRSNAFEKIDLKKLKRRIIRNTVILIIPSIFFGWQMVRQEMNAQSQVVETDNGQTMDLKTISEKEREVMEKLIQVHVENTSVEWK